MRLDGAKSLLLAFTLSALPSKFTLRETISNHSAPDFIPDFYFYRCFLTLLLIWEGSRVQLALVFQ
jgi:hypothetical protein